MYCYRHPKVETNLRCGKCGQPICPKCTVQTPVGARCRDCSKLTRLPVFQVSVVDYSKATGIGIVLAVGLGVGWGLVASYMEGFAYLLAVAVGYIIGELMSRGVNKKRSRGLQIISGVCVGVSCGVAILFGFYLSLYGIIALIVGIVLAVGQFK